MDNFGWLPPMLSYALESSVELMIIYLVVLGILHLKKLHHPTDISRYLLLPLVIPVLFTPLLHLIFPQLEHLILIRQLEKVLPWLEKFRSYEDYFVPWLAITFALILLYNMVRMAAVTLLEQRTAARQVNSRELNSFDVILRQLASKFGLPVPMLIVSDRRPFAAHSYGWRRPIVALGREWITRLDYQEIEAVLAHELAHFEQKDQLVMLVAKTCRDLLFFNPLANYIFKQLCQAREEATDIHALQITNNSLALASCLLKFWRIQYPKTFELYGINFMGSRNCLEQRIRRLVEPAVAEPAIPSNQGFFYSVFFFLTLAFSLI